ncbi:MAG: valine--tRNA ligase [Spirochaetia bacterium]|nr:valine--tRNA ligase [Spirochaetia bacterium]
MEQEKRKELPKQYSPHGLENKWYPIWEDKGYFSWKRNLVKNNYSEKIKNEDIEKIKKNREYFSIVIPPPNVTGSLHLGHALNHTIQDILTRYKRMKGLLTLWLPGTDHAGIATQNVVEKLLAKEGKKRWEMSREDFEKRVWQWKEESGGMITHQQRQLGESVDWNYERFTLDKGLSAIVKKVFVRLYNEKLIYRGERIINWCPRCTTALSNIEVEYSERNGKFFHIKYPVAGVSKDLKETDYLIVATTRPETMLGDEALAVHPDDERFSRLVGKKVILPLMKREIPVIADSFVDKDFGTGIVKITPSHDPNDFEVGRRHNLPLRRVMDDHGRINDEGKEYKGLSREEARKRIVSDLEKLNLLHEVEDMKHSVGECYRCSTIVEPLTSKQWFVDIKPLAERAIKSVKEKEIEFIPKRWENTYFEWMNNIQDWCISRQLWWGHRIPAYYCEECSHINVSEEEITECEKCKSDKLKQDEDVLDTWFSSALWPFSTMISEEEALSAKGWPENSDELKIFYPTSVLVTGFDIIFFWVARMIMMGLHFMDEVPFRKVYIHGLVRDATRQKMSKSKGNVINPLEKMDDYGTDAFRFFLISILPEGKDIIYDESRLKGYSAFCNKIWNTARYIWMNQPDNYTIPSEPPSEFSEIDAWIIVKHNESLQKLSKAIENYRFAEYAQEIYNFIWSSFCDNYLELSKTALKETENSSENIETTRYVLNTIFLNALKMLNPIMPFITEELYSFWGTASDLLITSDWPKEIALKNNSGYDATERTLSIVYKIRYLRGELALPVSEKIPAIVTVENDNQKEEIESHSEYICVLGKLNSLKVEKTDEKRPGVKAMLDFGKIYLDVHEKIDISLETKRITKEREHILKGLESLKNRLSNEEFLKKAPEELVLQEKEKMQSWENKIREFDEILESLS